MLMFGSLFAGIGGIDLGLERAGMRCAWQVEIDDYATRVLARHWPDVPKFRDVRECGAHNLARVDLIAGGFPCQPHSTAGKRKGAADDRNLWPEFARIIRELRPRWVLAENVPGLLSTDAGRFFGAVLGDLAAIGYDAEWEVISACAFGAPHTRERLFIVAYPAGARWRQGQRPEAGRVFLRDRRRDSQTGRVSRDDHYACEPAVSRMAHGVPARVDRLRGLGNAVVPQVAEFIGRYIIEHVSAQEQRKAA